MEKVRMQLSSRAESEEGMERLTKLKGNYVCWNGNQDYSTRDRYAKALNRLAAYEDTGLTPEQIQAQRQDIESLQRELNAEISVNEALTADKDEQAGRIIRYDTALKQARHSLRRIKNSLAIHTTFRLAVKAICKIDALLGGGEDGK